jgi:hypothetical protein
MLMMGPPLEITINPNEIKNTFATLDLGTIVREEATMCAMFENEIFQSDGHVRLKGHRVD